MLYLLLRMGDERYALEARRIVEVVPLVLIKPLPHTPAYVAGLFDYRGQWVPVIDLCRLTSERSCIHHQTTRIILVEYLGNTGSSHTLGLLAEQVTETIKLKTTDFQAAGIQVTDAPYLGGLAKSADTPVQLLDIEQLLPEALRQSLFAESA